MQCINKILNLREQLNRWRLAGDVIAFVPTMGNLHEGHMQLVSQAKKQADRVVVSLFVNPTQFGEGEDFSTYPRTEAQDKQKLESLKVDLLFMPEVTEIYPKKSLTTVSVTGVSEGYCGAKRVGHFDGVATVVSKLFNIVQPNKAFFGEKDFQQLAVIRAMVLDLNLPIEIIPVPIVRESNGLAMSSRNGYLTAEQKNLAAQLYASLIIAKEELVLGQAEYLDIEKEARDKLTQLGFEPEYFTICRQEDLKPAAKTDKQLVILLAAKLGQVRLIDNLQINL
ncbi:MAG: pantoate--beta-alanine ligase [Methyloprofundus sp.]|nr:pantoate--beta-alanine ligase [Methyloprofundus sp.]